MSQPTLEERKQLLDQLRQMNKKAFMPAPMDPNMPPPQQGMPPAMMGGMPPPPAGMDPAMMGGMPPPGAAPGGASPELEQAIVELMDGLNQAAEVIEQLNGQLAQQDQRLAQLEGQVQELMAALQSPAAME